MDTQTLSKIEEFAKSYCEKDTESDNLWELHTQLVRKYAIILAKIENADIDVVEIAAILHDIGKDKGRENHNERSYELSKEFLEQFKLPKKDLILKCILKHSSRFATEDNELEVKIVQCADALATLFDDDLQSESVKKLTKEQLLKIVDKTYNKINLNSARDLAKPQVDKLRLKIEEHYKTI